MATTTKTLRGSPALWALLESQAKREGVTANALAVTILERGLGAVADEPAPVPRKAAPKVRATAPPSKGRAHPVPAAKPAAAREALAQVETRVGVKSRLDMSSVPFVGQGKRPAYQRARDKRG